MMRRGGLRPTAPCRAERAAPPNPELERTAQSLRETYGKLDRSSGLYAGLESLKLGYGGDRQMAEILGLDVSTVARGRRELLEHDVNVERVRKAGAGRKAVEKNRQKSSRRSKNLKKR